MIQCRYTARVEMALKYTGKYMSNCGESTSLQLLSIFFLLNGNI